GPGPSTHTASVENHSRSNVSFFFPIPKVQVVQLLPKLFDRTKQVYLHGSNVQIEQLGDFRQTPIFIMPQSKRRPLPQAELLKSPLQPLGDLICKNPVFRVRIRRLSQGKNGGLV